jgi:hypothetical protein
VRRKSDAKPGDAIILTKPLGVGIYSAAIKKGVQMFLGFDPEAQPEYGMESEAYGQLVANVRHAVSTYPLRMISRATGVSARYLRAIRVGTANTRVTTLKRIERAIPGLEVEYNAQVAREREVMQWARPESIRIGLREFARQLDVDAANLGKMLAGKRRPSQRVLKAIMKLRQKAKNTREPST